MAARLFSGPVLVDDSVLQALEALVPLAPLHQPHNLEPIRIVRRRLPEMPQVACFDTAFHQTPVRNRDACSPCRSEMRERGVRRYGFHGLSYDYIASVLERLRSASCRRAGDRRASRERRKPVRSQGQAPASRRPWDSPPSTACRWERAAAPSMPASIFYMLREMKLSPEEAERMLYTKSGLLGVSGISNDMRVLRVEGGDEAGCQACHRTVRLSHHARNRIACRGARRHRRTRLHGRASAKTTSATRAEVIAGLAWAGLTLDDAANRDRRSADFLGIRTHGVGHPHKRGTGHRDGRREA